MAPNGRKWATYTGEQGWWTQGSPKRRKGNGDDKTSSGKHAAGGRTDWRRPAPGIILPGVAKEPLWKCPKCSFGSNWRSRTHCESCGRQTAKEHLAAIIAESAASKNEGSTDSARPGCSAAT